MTIRELIPTLTAVNRYGCHVTVQCSYHFFGVYSPENVPEEYLDIEIDGVHPVNNRWDIYLTEVPACEKGRISSIRA